MLRTALVLFLVAASVLAEQKSFRGFKQFSVEVRDEGDAIFLSNLAEQNPEIDFWLEPAPGHRTTVVVPPNLVQTFTQNVETEGMDIQVMNEDISELVRKSFERTPEDVAEMKRQISNYVVDHSNYHTYQGIRNYLVALDAEYPEQVSLEQLRYLTHEGRPVDMAILRGDEGAAPKPAIIVEAGIHAREWISPAANLYAIEKMLQGYRAGNADARYMLNNYDWYVVPVSNPDGYEYTISTNRMWRKNRRYISRTCYGIDLNRNFDAQFGTTGVSSNCGSDIYNGETAFSEPETQNVRDLFNEHYTRVLAYVSVHSYSQYILVPWAYSQSNQRPPNYQENDRVTLLMRNAISSAYGKNYRHGTAWSLLNYAASGSSKDWALLSKPGIYALAYELRPDANSSIGFLLPASEIVESGEEYYASLVVLAREMNKP